MSWTSFVLVRILDWCSCSLNILDFQLSLFLAPPGLALAESTLALEKYCQLCSTLYLDRTKRTWSCLASVRGLPSLWSQIRLLGSCSFWLFNGRKASGFLARSGIESWWSLRCWAPAAHRVSSVGFGGSSAGWTGKSCFELCRPNLLLPVVSCSAFRRDLGRVLTSYCRLQEAVAASARYELHWGTVWLHELSAKLETALSRSTPSARKSLAGHGSSFARLHWSYFRNFHRLTDRIGCLSVWSSLFGLVVRRTCHFPVGFERCFEFRRDWWSRG